MASRYESLGQYLELNGGASTEMKFDQVADLVGGLPPAARQYRAWWSNNESHSHARCGWMAAGWRTAKVDMPAQKLVFERVTTPATRALQRGEGRPAEWADMEERAGGPENLLEILRAVDRYVEGEIAESELGRVIRRFWRRRRD